MTPSRFLPPPWWRKLWTRVLIAVGYICGRGYWYWDMRQDVLYWNDKQSAVWGMRAEPSVGNYQSLFECRLWDESDREHVRKTVELALTHRTEFRHQFCAKDQSTGEKIIVTARGKWLLDEHGQPWALYGYNARLRARGRNFEVAEAEIKVRQAICKWRECGLPPSLSHALRHAHR